MSDLNGKTAIVCGGSAGVGKATVDALIAQGCRVGVIARGTQRLQQLERDFGVATNGLPRIATASADVADATALDIAAGSLIAKLGTPEIWVNCAMATAFSRFCDMEPEEFNRIVDVTFIGQVNGCRSALKHMARGTIVNVGSGLSYRSVPLQSAYCAAKHAINGFTASLRSELIRDGHAISLSLVQLPALDTPQFDWARNRLDEKPQPAPPIYAPEVAADAILRAAREAPRELLVGASVLKLVGAQAAAPDWLDHKMAQAGADMQTTDVPDTHSRPDNLFDPVDYPAKAKGSYTDRSRQTGIIVDGDRARLAGLAGVALIGAALGAALSTALPRTRRNRIQ